MFIHAKCVLTYTCETTTSIVVSRKAQCGRCPIERLAILFLQTRPLFLLWIRRPQHGTVHRLMIDTETTLLRSASPVGHVQLTTGLRCVCSSRCPPENPTGTLSDTDHRVSEIFEFPLSQAGAKDMSSGVSPNSTPTPICQGSSARTSYVWDLDGLELGRLAC